MWTLMYFYEEKETGAFPEEREFVAKVKLVYRGIDDPRESQITIRNRFNARRQYYTVTVERIDADGKETVRKVEPYELTTTFFPEIIHHMKMDVNARLYFLAIDFHSPINAIFDKYGADWFLGLPRNSHSFGSRKIIGDVLNRKYEVWDIINPGPRYRIATKGSTTWGIWRVAFRRFYNHFAKLDPEIFKQDLDNKEEEDE
jgi:hypothetical protein